jgi:hypothetical protein
VALAGSAVLGGVVLAWAICFPDRVWPSSRRSGLLRAEIHNLEVQIKEISNIEARSPR